MVLVLDDDAGYVDFYRSILNVHDISVGSFTLAEDAIRSFRGMPDLYDCAVLDVFLHTSELDGVAVARALREMRPELPILFITGLEDDANIAILQKYGQYQRKRTTFEKLAEVLYRFASESS